ncbi:MAG: stage V sporulation protein AD [Bacillota bacterium]
MKKNQNKKIGKQTIRFATPVRIAETSAIVGEKEGSGPLGKYFKKVIPEATFGEDSWEQAESKFVNENMKVLIEKSGLEKEEIDYILCGDLLNQCSASTFGVAPLEIPFFGLFGACSTMGESMSLGAILIDGGFATHTIAGASSHFCAAEKQFRTPLPVGNQRPPTTTWTVTGAGAVLLTKSGDYPLITHVTTGKVVDMGITDPNNMGAAMAPAAADLIIAHFQDTGTEPKDYDWIVTGDLGDVGKQLLIRLVAEANYSLIPEKTTDCGIEIFDDDSQDTHCGGSGCACSAVTFASFFYPKLCSGEIEKMLFVPTGALMSTTTAGQGLSIPAIAHGLVIEGRKNKKGDVDN